MLRPKFQFFLCLVLPIFFLMAGALAQDSASVPTAALAIPDLLRQASQAFYSGKFETAIENYQAAIQQDPKSGQAYAGLVRVYLKQQKVALALDTATRGVAQAANSPYVHTAMGEVYFRQAKIGEAEREFLSAFNASPPDPRAGLDLSRLYDVYSFHARARRMLDRAHELDPNDREILRRWTGAQRLSEQIRSLQNYLSGPTNDDAEERRALEERLAFLQAREKQPHSACTLATKLTSTETELIRLGDPTHFHGFGLEIKVNGHAAHPELDTGATGLLITRGLADKAGIHPLSDVHVGGVGDQGESGGFVGYADSIKIGQLEFQNCLVAVSDRLNKLQIDGLVGADVFSPYLVTLDFPNRKLKLEELPKRPGVAQKLVSLSTERQEEGEAAAEDEDQGQDKSVAAASPAPAKTQAADPGPQDAYLAPEMQSYTKVFRFGHLLLIPTRVGDTPPKFFLIDTGAMLNNISPEAASEVTKVHASDVRVHGLSGDVNKVYEADKAVVQFSHFRQTNLDLITFDLSSLSKNLGTEVSGVLGIPTLVQLIIKIDYRDGLVDFLYKAP